MILSHLYIPGRVAADVSLFSELTAVFHHAVDVTLFTGGGGICRLSAYSPC